MWPQMSMTTRGRMSGFYFKFVGVAMVAFHADVLHKVLPVTAGCRWALVFDLLSDGPSPSLLATVARPRLSFLQRDARFLAPASLHRDWLAEAVQVAGPRLVTLYMHASESLPLS